MSLLLLLDNEDAGSPTPAYCSYPLDAPPEEIALIGGNALTMSNSYQTGTLEIIGSAQGDTLAAPVNISTFEMAMISLNSGKKVVGFRLQVPAAVDQDAVDDFTAYEGTGQLTILPVGRNVQARVVARIDGTFDTVIKTPEADDNGGFPAYIVQSQPSAPEYFWLVFDATSETVAVYVDESETPLVLTYDGYPPGDAVAIIRASETDDSDAGDIGKQVVITLITDAASMPAHLASLGATDKCGNAL